jgi:phosphatidylglycerol:prolipoprotein diacylglycerol transferase
VDTQYFHPTFLYESLWNAGTFVILYFVLRRRLERAPGALFLAYLGLYSLGRFWVEGLRTDSLMLGSFRIAQIVSVAAVVVAVVGIPILLRRRRT